MRDDEIRELTELENELRGPVGALPHQHDAAELAAIHTQALRIAARPPGHSSRAEGAGIRTRTSWWTRRRLGVSASLAAATVLAVAVLGWGLAHTQTAAFAAASAAEALLPQNRALHFTEMTTQADSPGRGQPCLRREYWIAPGGTTTRDTMSLASNGQLLTTHLTQGAGGHARVGTYRGYEQAFGSNPQSMGDQSQLKAGRTPTLESVRDQPVGAGGPGTDDPKEGVRWWLDLRADLKSGKAQVLGSQTIRGQRYWHVRSADATFTPVAIPMFENGKWVASPPSPDAPTLKKTVDAFLRESDYQPARVVITRVDEDHSDSFDENGVAQPRLHTTTITCDIQSWQTVAANDVPTSTFDLNSIPTAGAPTVNLSYYPAELRDFREFRVWVLAPDFRLANGSVAATPELDNGTQAYVRGRPLSTDITVGDPSIPDLGNFPPDGFSALTDRCLYGMYDFNFGGRNGGVVAFMASMPRASEASVTAFLNAKRAQGRAVTGIANGLRYRGVENLRRSGPSGPAPQAGVVVIDAGREMLVVAYQGGPLHKSPLPDLIAALRLANP